MYKLEFTLKQHTPIIHFQYFLTDATLRSTELKSALDKFMIGKKCNCWSSDKKERLEEAKSNEELSKWLKHIEKPSNPSFDYDVELVFHNANPTITKPEQYGFFGNMMGEVAYEDKTKHKKAILFDKPITLIIKSVYSDLITYIDKIICEFFLIKNFGTRQSKGFGSFFPIEKYTELETQNLLPYYFDYEKLVSGVTKKLHFELFEVINLFYNTLRSGINKPNGSKNGSLFYFKSLMWAYAKSKNEHWDKKSIKNRYLTSKKLTEDTKWEVLSPEYKTTPTDFPLGYYDSITVESQRHLWRDVLGLSSDEKWGVKKKIDESTSKTNRLKSPIIFKPIMTGENQYRIFFGVPPHIQTMFKSGHKLNTESEILGNIFKVDFKKQVGLKLKYPDTFDFKDFLNFSIKTYNTSWVESNYHDCNEFKIINNIFEQLKLRVDE